MGVIGHNFPPVRRLEDKAADLSKRIEGLPDVIDGENAALFRDLLAAGSALAREIDASRKTEKQPHLDAAAEVDRDYRIVIEQVGRLVAVVRASLTSWAQAEEQRRREEAEAAERRRQEAEELARQAQETAGDDPFGAIDAEEAERDAAIAGLEADHAAKRAAHAPSVGSAAGYRAGSLRTSRKASITDAKALVAHYAESPSVVAEALKLANGAIRAARGGPVNIPGVEIVEEKSFV